MMVAMKDLIADTQKLPSILSISPRVLIIRLRSPVNQHSNPFNLIGEMNSYVHFSTFTGSTPDGSLYVTMKGQYPSLWRAI